MKKRFYFSCLLLIGVGCKPNFKSLTKDEQQQTIKANVVNYCGDKLKANDLTVNNYLLAYKREMAGVRSAANHSLYDNLHFIDGKTDSVEVSFQLANTHNLYKKSIKGNPAFTTGLKFAIDNNGEVKNHKGYIMYYGANEDYTYLTGENANLLYTSFNK
jgi:hypothetical protein